ncbi:MAG: hypothetical protein IV086_01815 [Hyphomonadaceae bacterium]|nr:hypothetical protein [Hyphomonadaceae bacterium]
MADDAHAGGQDVRSRLSKKLPSSRLGFSKQIEVLRAFGILSAGGSATVHYSKAAEMIGAHESNVSTTNPFFVENGFLEKSGNGHLPSSAVLDFSRQHSWNPERAPSKLAPLVSKTWFARAILPKLDFRRLSEEEAIEVLAEECSAEPDAKSQIRTLIEYLEFSGLLRRENGQLVPIKDAPLPPSEAIRPPDDHSAPLSQPDAPAKASSAGQVSFQVSINVDMAELSGWPADRIAAFFSGMAQVIAAKNKGSE